MEKFVAPSLRQRQKVNAYFQSQSSYWEEIYARDDVQGEIYRDRHAAVLDWIDGLGYAPGCQVLEIGCGAGFMTVALAQRGFRVHAIDSTEAMIDIACRHVKESGTGELISLEVGDVYSLASLDNSFDLVIAIGIIPWLGWPELAVQEMARVTKPGGHIILTANNRAGLSNLLDPWLNPALAPVRQHVKAALVRLGLRRRSPDAIGAVFHDRCYIDEIVANAELVKAKSLTLGFGPFSLMRYKILPEPFSTALHHRLQRLADRDVPGFRSAGAHYVVLVRKPASQPVVQSTST